MVKRKDKHKESRKPLQFTREECNELVKKADLATSTLYPLRWKGRKLREDIGDGESELENIRKEIQEYTDVAEKNIKERLEKLKLFRDAMKVKLVITERITKERLQDIEKEKVGIEKSRSESEGDAEFLRVRLMELQKYVSEENNHIEKIHELENFFHNLEIEHEETLQQLKMEFTRELRNMKKDYDKKINSTNKCAKKMLRPCITEKINCMRESNINFVNNLRRISKKRGVLSEKIVQKRLTTNNLKCQLELWKDVRQRKLETCDPHLIPSNNLYENDMPKEIETAFPEGVKLETTLIRPAPYKELRRTLRLLLRPEESSSDSDG